MLWDRPTAQSQSPALHNIPSCIDFVSRKRWPTNANNPHVLCLLNALCRCECTAPFASFFISLKHSVPPSFCVCTLHMLFLIPSLPSQLQKRRGCIRLPPLQHAIHHVLDRVKRNDRLSHFRELSCHEALTCFLYCSST